MSIPPVVIHPMNNGYINSLTPTLNGTGEPNATICTTINNINYTTQVKENGTWSLQVRNLSEGSLYQFKVQQINTSGTVMDSPVVTFQANPGLMTAHVIDTPQENQPINTTIPTIQGTGKAGATISIASPSGTVDTVVSADGTWSVTLDKPLNQGVNTISATQIDMGNMSVAANRSFLVDSVPPPEPIVTSPTDMGVIKTPQPVISGQGEPGANVDVTVDEKTYHTVVNPGGQWSVEVSGALVDTEHMLSVKQRDAANNISPEKVLLFEIDTKLPDAPVVQSPISNQYLTNAMPVIMGSAESGNTIQAIFAGKVYTATVGSDSIWQVKVTDRLPDGNQIIKLYQVDKAGNVSQPADLLLKIDTSVPAVPAVLFPLQNGFVNSTSFTMHGTGEPDATVVIKVASRELSVLVSRDGSWSVAVDLPDKHPYSAVISQWDAAGNHSQPLDLHFNIDAGSLRAPQIDSPGMGSWLNTNNPIISGVARPGSTVFASISSTTLSATTDDTGKWQMQPGQLPQGQHALCVWQNAMGNISAKTTISFQIKTSIPVAPMIQSPANHSQIGTGQVSISGMADPQALLDIHVDTQTLSTTADASGKWSVMVPGVLPNGIHAILARQKDPAGNAGPFSDVLFQTLGQADIAATQDVMPVVAQITCNPSGPRWQSKTIAVLTANKPVKVNDIQGTCFARVVASNGLCSFTYTDLAGTEFTAVAGIDWLDDLPPVIDITPGKNGNLFSADKTIHFYKYGPSGLQNALLNGTPVEYGAIVNIEGWYTVEVNDHAGNKCIKSFLIDRTAPTVTGVYNGMTANSDVCLNFFDNLSGIKAASLNGTPISPGTVVSSNGSYQLILCDHADNRTQLDFQISKT